MEDIMSLSLPVFTGFMQAVCRIVEIRQIEPMLEQIVFQALEIFNGQSGFLAFLDDDGALEFRVRRNRQGVLIDLPDPAIQQAIHKQALLPRQLWMGPHITGEADIFLAAPLIARGRLLGVLYLEHCAAGENVERLLREFSTFSALAIENARFNEKLETVAGENKEAQGRLKQELERLSMMDPLTGIANHRHFYEMGKQIFTRSAHPPYELAALVMEIDNYPQLVEEYGQITGEAVQQIVINRLLQGLRPSDLIGRYAGEKIAVLLPRTAWDDACTVAERLRAGISLNMIDVGFNNLPLTISVGVAGMTADSRTLAELLGHADQALTIAQSRMGNRWVVWQTSP